MTNPAIAKRMGISLDAVKFHVSNALTKLGFARRRELRKWDGVNMDSLLHAQPKRDGSAAALGSLGQISRSVGDIDAAVSWYRDTLGLQYLFTAQKLAFFNCGGTRLMLAEGDGAANSVLYFRVDDIREFYRQLHESGVEVLSAPHMIHRHPDGMEEWMAFFNDNEGRTLAIMSQVSQASTDGGSEND